MSIIGEGSLGDIPAGSLGSPPIYQMVLDDIDYFFEDYAPTPVTVDGNLWGFPIDYYFEIPEVLVEQTHALVLPALEVLTEIEPDLAELSEDYEDLSIGQEHSMVLGTIEFDFDPAPAEYDYGWGIFLIPARVLQHHQLVGTHEEVATEVDDVLMVLTHQMVATTPEVTTEIDDITTLVQTHSMVLENPNYQFEIDTVTTALPNYCESYESTLVRDGQLMIEGFQAAGSAGVSRWRSHNTKDTFKFSRVWTNITRAAAEHIERYYDARDNQEFTFVDHAENPTRSYRCVVTEDVIINPIGHSDQWMASVKFQGYALAHDVLWTRETVSATEAVLAHSPRAVVSTIRTNQPPANLDIADLNEAVTNSRSYIIRFISTDPDIGTDPWVTCLYKEGGQSHGAMLGVASGKIFFTQWRDHNTGTGDYVYLEDSLTIKPNVLYTVMATWDRTGPVFELWVNGAKVDSGAGTWENMFTFPAHTGDITVLSCNSDDPWGPPGYKDLTGETYDTVSLTHIPRPRLEGWSYQLYMYTTVISDSDYVAFCQDPADFPSGVCHYRLEMDTGSGTVLYDTSPTPQNIAMNGATWLSSKEHPTLVVVEGADLKWVSTIDITFHGTTEDLTAVVSNIRCVGTTTSFCVVIEDDLGDPVSREFSWVINGVREN